MLRKLLICAVAILVSASIARADFPAEEAWRVELDTTATCLGSSWQDEEGRTFFLVGTRNRAFLISENEIIWESQELPGYITALNQVDFGVGDGPEIFVATLSDSGRVHEFSGEEYRDHSIRVAFGTFEHFDPPWMERGDNRLVTTIDYFEDALPDSSKRLLYGKGYSTSSGGMNGSFSRYRFRLNDSEIFDTNDDGELDICYASKSSHSSGGALEIDYGGSSCDVKIRNQGGRTISTRILASYSWQREEEWQKHVNVYRIKAVEITNGDRMLFATYKDTSSQNLACLTLPDLEIYRIIHGFPSNVSMPVYCYSIGDSTVAFLLCLSSSGISAFCVNTMQFVQVEENFIENPIGSLVGQFDNDAELEMAVLTQTTFIVYDLGPLASPYRSLPPLIPEIFTITAAYPNPFNAEAIIEYELPRSGQYTLTIHDLTGTEITRLSKGWQIAGVYQTVWNAAGAPSGTYLIRLNGRNSGAARAIQLVR